MLPQVFPKITPTISGAAGLTATQSGLLGDIVARYTAIIAGKLSKANNMIGSSDSSGALREFIIEIDASNTTSDVISMETRYGYSITADVAIEGVVRGTAESIFGAQYALESFVQLLDAHISGAAGLTATQSGLLGDILTVIGFLVLDFKS